MALWFFCLDLLVQFFVLFFRPVVRFSEFSFRWVYIVLEV